MKDFKDPVFIRTSTGLHNADDVDQCACCGILEDPNNMDEIDGKGYCLLCAKEKA